MVTAVWLTPTAARAFVSASLAQDDASPNAAEARYNLLRQSDKHKVLIRIHEMPIGLENMKVGARLEIGSAHGKVAAVIERVPFPMDGVINDDPHFRGFIAAFPRCDANGARTISTLDDDLTLVVQIPGQPIRIRLKPNKIASVLDDL